MMTLPPLRWLCAAALFSLSTACARNTPAAPVERSGPLETPSQVPDTSVLAEDVSVRRLAPGVWLHVTVVTTERFGRVSTNEIGRAHV